MTVQTPTHPTTETQEQPLWASEQHSLIKTKYIVWSATTSRATTTTTTMTTTITTTSTAKSFSCPTRQLCWVCVTLCCCWGCDKNQMSIFCWNFKMWASFFVYRHNLYSVKVSKQLFALLHWYPVWGWGLVPPISFKGEVWNCQPVLNDCNLIWPV